MNEIEARVMRAVSRPGGASAREIRDSLNGPERKKLRIARDAMVCAGQIFSATHRFPGSQRANIHYFATQAHADAWKLQEVAVAKTVAPLKTMFTATAPRRGHTIRSDTPVAPHTIKPQRCPVSLDHRYSVRKLPAGHISALNTAECSPWAMAATERT